MTLLWHYFPTHSKNHRGLFPWSCGRPVTDGRRLFSLLHMFNAQVLRLYQRSQQQLPSWHTVTTLTLLHVEQICLSVWLSRIWPSYWLKLPKKKIWSSKPNGLTKILLSGHYYMTLKWFVMCSGVVLLAHVLIMLCYVMSCCGVPLLLPLLLLPIWDREDQV